METIEIVENKSSKKMNNESTTNEQVAVKNKNKTFAIILVVLVALGGYYGVSKYIHGEQKRTLSDIQI
ncbi:hypothetical protein MYP_2863 [Sporocytophaga myxococcoides]|uniref:Uncharacterized protein n=1 Tax=Sporocytophaga myxococcoides TaxID=153721 RepID=A0A098LGP1_9BACT|nr:hypothetical protein [Sporocytophaga myxococcoides]GAL85634.1 hypothetical protein MYP_2863 [Sporocytophaga myxococcoides]